VGELTAFSLTFGLTDERPVFPLCPAIAACDGDARATVRAFIVANNFLQSELDYLKDHYSSGFARGKLRMRDLP